MLEGIVLLAVAAAQVYNRHSYRVFTYKRVVMYQIILFAVFKIIMSIDTYGEMGIYSVQARTFLATIVQFLGCCVWVTVASNVIASPYIVRDEPVPRVLSVYIPIMSVAVFLVAVIIGFAFQYSYNFSVWTNAIGWGGLAFCLLILGVVVSWSMCKLDLTLKEVRKNSELLDVDEFSEPLRRHSRTIQNLMGLYLFFSLALVVLCIALSVRCITAKEQDTSVQDRNIVHQVVCEIMYLFVTVGMLIIVHQMRMSVEYSPMQLEAGIEYIDDHSVASSADSKGSPLLAGAPSGTPEVVWSQPLRAGLDDLDKHIPTSTPQRAVLSQHSPVWGAMLVGTPSADRNVVNG